MPLEAGDAKILAYNIRGEILTPGLTSSGATPVVTEPAPGEISSPGVESTNPGGADSSGFTAILLAIISLL